MRQKFKYFTVFADMRTGSNLLETHLNEFDGLSCHGELYNPEFVGFPNKKSVVDVTLAARELDPFATLGQLIDHETGSIPGFRIFSNHDIRISEHCLADLECAKVILTRHPLESFVSLCIASETDQWKMADLYKRRKLKINFDITAFRKYLAVRRNYMNHINRQLRITGQTAYWIDYDVINDLDVINGLGEFLGATKHINKLPHKMARQNPENMAEKVSNYDEMMGQIGALDVLGASLAPYVKTKQDLDTKQFYVSNDPSLLFFPVGASLIERVISWMPNNVKSGLKKPQLNDLLKSNQDRSVFAVLDHPVDRAYHAFYTHIFCTDKLGFPWLRENLTSFYDIGLPDAALCEAPDRSVLATVGYGVEQHQHAFSVFLKYLKGNLRGQTRARIDTSWASQLDIVNGLFEWLPPDMVIKPDDLEKSLRYLDVKHGRTHSTAARQSGPPYVFTLDEIYSVSIEKQARAAYNVDYNRFGFADWTQ